MTPRGMLQAKALLAAPLPGPDAAAAAAARARQARLVKPPGALGRLERLAVWAAAWQGRETPGAGRAFALVFAASHGVARRGVSRWPPEVTAQMVETFHAGGAAINRLAEAAGFDLRIGALSPESPCADITAGPALSEEEFSGAFAYGAETVAALEAPEVVLLGEMGIGNTTAAAALCLALHGGRPEDWVGPGAGVDGEGMARKRRAVAEALEANRAAAEAHPLEALRALGGLESAAIAGAALEARRRRALVLLDGFASTAAAAPLAAARPGALDHALVAHRSREPGHARLLARLGKRPLLDLDMALGEASGAALALPLLRAALACHAGMATFEEAGVSSSEAP